MEIIKLPCADSKKSRMVELEFSELELGDDYFIHRAKGVRESNADDDGMGEGIWTEKSFDYEHRFLKRFILGCDFGYYNEDESYCVTIDISGDTNEALAWMDTFDEAKELADKVWKWILSSTK